LSQRNSNPKIVNHFYQNPVFLAKQYKRMIGSGEVKNQANLVLKLGISKVCVPGSQTFKVEW
jgi:hypothetical protein